MQKMFNDYRVAAIVAGILTEIANIYINFIPAWFCYVPLMIVLQKATSTRIAFRAGFIFGLTMSIISLYWIIPGAQRFTGSSSIYGVIVFLISTIVMCFYFGFINYLFGLLKIQEKRRFDFILNGLLIASVYVMGELLLTVISTGMPWFGFHSGTGLLSNLYAIQPAAFMGMHIISFVVVFINYLIAASIAEQKWIRLVFPALVGFLYMATGYFMYSQFKYDSGENKKFSLSILSENIAPEVRWDESTGNILVGKILALDSVAAIADPDIILWSESAVPWTYEPNDDLVKQLLKITAAKNITHILGINSAYMDEEVYNSVYSLAPSGKIEGRYDKRFLLSFIEEKVGGFIFPFFSSGGFFVKAGESAEPLNTPHGKAGVMICNESTVPSAASSMVKNGAQYLVNLSNDGWFSDTYLVDLHYYNVRLRAVESRRDIAINSNNGYSGLIDAAGNLVMKERSNDPFVKTVELTPNNTMTMAVTMPSVLIFFCAAYISALAVRRFVKKEQ